MSLRRNNKTIAIMMAFVFCLSFLAPGFVTPDKAEAAVNYQILKTVTIPSNDLAAGTALGTVKVTAPAAEVLDGSILTVSLPSSLGVVDSVYVDTTNNLAKGICVVVPAGPQNDPNALVAGDIEVIDNSATSNSFDLKVKSHTGNGEAWFYVYFNKIDLNNFVGDVEVDFIAPSNSAFSTALKQIIAKVGTSGDTMISVKSVKTVNEDNAAVDLITIGETAAETFDPAKDLKIELATKGFTFKSHVLAPTNLTGGALVQYGWGLTGSAKLDVASEGKTISGALTGIPTTYTESGRLTIAGIQLEVDPSYAKVGDIEAKISGAGITAQTVVIAKYAEYNVAVTEDTSKEIFAGKAEQEIGSFIVEEAVGASVLDGRTVTLTLPDGVKWSDNSYSTKVLAGNNLIDTTLNPSASVIGSDETMLRFKTKASQKASKVKLSGMKVNVSPSFTGDLEVEITGTAGIEGKVKLATVVPSVKVEATPVDVILGLQNQKAGVIKITESSDGALSDDNAYIYVQLDNGFRFAQKPVVKVTAGDLDLDLANTKLDTDYECLEIKVKSNSVKTAGTIEISDVYLTGLRYAPEGAVKAKVFGNAIIDAAVATAWNDEAVRVTIANCVTPAQGGGNVTFKVNSNIYYVNGVAKVMDVAPYIKNARTYIPMRYIAESLGAEVVWEAAAQTVTLTKADTTIVFTIGSTSYTVNGEAKTMDVAPEINNDRTMLPARFVAEAFGTIVGWDPTTGTVLIQ